MRFVQLSNKAYDDDDDDDDDDDHTTLRLRNNHVTLNGQATPPRTKNVPIFGREHADNRHDVINVDLEQTTKKRSRVAL